MFGPGARYVWDSCQDTVDPLDHSGDAIAAATAIYTYAYSADAVCVAPTRDWELQVTECDGTFWSLLNRYPRNAGCAGFDAPGHYPCGELVPIEETTWGDIKRRY